MRDHRVCGVGCVGCGWVRKGRADGKGAGEPVEYALGAQGSPALAVAIDALCKRVTAHHARELACSARQHANTLWAPVTEDAGASTGRCCKLRSAPSPITHLRRR